VFILSFVKGSGVPQATPFWTDERGVRTYCNYTAECIWVVARCPCCFTFRALGSRAHLTMTGMYCSICSMLTYPRPNLFHWPKKKASSIDPHHYELHSIGNSLYHPWKKPIHKNHAEQKAVFHSFTLQKSIKNYGHVSRPKGMAAVKHLVIPLNLCWTVSSFTACWDNDPTAAHGCGHASRVRLNCGWAHRDRVRRS
jgi:hypothetical protein